MHDLAIQESVLSHVWRFGGKVFSVDAGEVLEDDPDDPMRTAVRQMVGVFAELERGMIAARLPSGRKAKVAAEGYIGGRPPLGYRLVDGALVEEPTEQLVLKRVTELREGGLSYGAIARRLSDEGLKPTRGRQWHISTLQAIARRTVAS